MKQSTFYKRRLPHWQPPISSFFITYRLAGSIPVSIIKQINEKQKVSDRTSKYGSQFLNEECFKDYDKALDENRNEPHWLKLPEIARIVMDSLLFNNQKEYKLSCATIMSNHVHTVFTSLESSSPLNKILQNHKKFTAREANIILRTSGQFWAEESFDTLIRNNDHFHNVVRYCLQNPVKAGLVKNWQDWKWTYLDPVLKQKFSNQ